jgi:hypothetical protein
MTKVDTTRYLAIAAASLWLALVASGQVPVDDTETWSESGTAGWTNTSPAAAVSNPGGHLQLTHLGQSLPVYVKDTVRAAIEPGVRVTNIALRVGAFEHAPSSVRLEFHAAQSGRIWYYLLERPGVGEQLSYSVPVSYAGGSWKVGPNSSEREFDDDIVLVDWVGVALTRNADVAKQDYVIDDFRLQGIYVEDLDEDGVPNGWELDFGFDPENAADAALDPDGDWMSNYAEYWAGTRPDDAESALRLEISVTNNASGGKAVLLSWPSAPERTYEVLSGEAPGETLSALASGVPATPGTNVYEDVTAEGETRIYRVRVETP